MAIDTSIYNNIRPVQIESPVNALAQVMQLKQAQNQNRLADLVFSEKQREAAEAQGLGEVFKGALNPDGSIDRTKVFTGAAERGYGSRIPQFQETFAKQDKAAAELDKSRFDAMKGKLEIAGQAFGYVRNNPTLEAANQVLDYLGTNGVYDAQTVERYKQVVAADPTKIKALADQAFQTVLATEKQLSSFQTRNTGATTDTLETNPLTGVRVVNSVRNTMSPDAVASNAIARENLNLRREELTQKKVMDKETIKQNAANSQKVNDARDVLGLLDEVDALLPKATNGALGVAGNFVAGTMGMSTEGANATAQLKALQGALVSKMPKMTGPQSDKDVQLYREMAGQVGDPMVPRAQRQAAAATIRKLNEKYAGVPEGSSKKSGGVVDFGSLK